MIVITEQAVQKIAEMLKTEGKPGQALRVAIHGRGRAGFNYRLGFVDPTERAADDTVVDCGVFQVYVDATTVPDLTGTTIEYVETEVQCGFKIENPNPLWRDPVAQQVQKIIDEQINPAVGGHGGWITLLDVRDGKVFIQFGGGCQGCGMVDTTLKQGVSVRIREAIPEIREILDTTDHAGGTNPYFRG